MLVITVPIGEYVDVGAVRIRCINAGPKGARLRFECDRSTVIVRSNAKNKLPRKPEEVKK